MIKDFDFNAWLKKSVWLGPLIVAYTWKATNENSVYSFLKVYEERLKNIPATVCSNGILIIPSKCKAMNGLYGEFHKPQRQPITVFLMFRCCCRMVSSTRAETENRTTTIRKNVLTLMLKLLQREEYLFMVRFPTEAIKFTWRWICVSVCSAVVTLEISTRFVTSTRRIFAVMREIRTVISIDFSRQTFE
jgi:hypothetical protein